MQQGLEQHGLEVLVMILWFGAPLLAGSFPLFARRASRPLVAMVCLPIGLLFAAIVAWALVECPPGACSGPRIDAYLIPFMVWPLGASATVAALCSLSLMAIERCRAARRAR